MAGRERCLGSAGAIPLLEPDRLTRRVQSKDLPTGLVVGHSGTVIVAEAAEGVGLGGDDRGRYARTDARLAPDKREPLAASVAAVKEPTGVLAKLAAVEAGDVEVAEARDGSAEMREQHAGHPAKRGGWSHRSTPVWLSRACLISRRRRSHRPRGSSRRSRGRAHRRGASNRARVISRRRWPGGGQAVAEVAHFHVSVDDAIGMRCRPPSRTAS